MTAVAVEFRLRLGDGRRGLSGRWPGIAGVAAGVEMLWTIGISVKRLSWDLVRFSLYGGGRWGTNLAVCLIGSIMISHCGGMGGIQGNMGAIGCGGK